MRVQCVWAASFSLLFTLFAVQAQAQGVYTNPPLPGTMDVRDIDTNALLTIMNTGNSGFIPVAAHRGFWRTLPESSTQAIAAAYDAGVEAVEIDVRYASAATNSNPFTDPDALLVLSHDECVDRQTNGTGSIRYNPDSRCTGHAGMSGAAYTGLYLRDRRGTVTPYNPPTFKQALQTLAGYLSTASGSLTGPILIVDLKDRDIPSGGANDAWNEYIACLSVMTSVMPSGDWPAVLFKLKMNSQPPPIVMNTELNSHPAYGHMIQTIMPEDTSSSSYGPNGTAFNPSGCSPSSPCLLGMSTQSPPYIQQFELVPADANDGTSAYAVPGTGPLLSFATYYQPSSLPEGVATRFALCCSLAPLIISETSAPQNITKTDIRGILDFSTYYSGVSMITSDNLLETLNYLQTLGVRNTALIESSTEAPAPPGGGVGSDSQ